jgi:hypothetical protein
MAGRRGGEKGRKREQREGRERGGGGEEMEREE